MKGILGRKYGMTSLFLADGAVVPVTIVSVEDNAILQIKNKQKDGYNALKLGIVDKKLARSNRAQIEEAKKASTSPKSFVREIRNMTISEKTQTVGLEIFKSGDFVDVTSISKGKGFSGSIKRHNQSRGPMSHGSKSHRVTGSSGSISSTVKKTKKMPGRMGHEQVTVQNLQIISIDSKEKFITIKGAIPGPNKAFVVIKEAVKKGDISKAPVELVNVREIKIKNELIEEGKKYNANLNSMMTIEEMRKELKNAEIKHEQELAEYDSLLEKAKKLEINMDKAEKMKLDELREEVEKIETILKEKAKNEGEQ